MQELLSMTFIMGIMTLSMQNKHFIYSLLCIEAMMLSMFMLILFYANHTISMIHLPSPIMLLTISACEASIGLSIMIATTRMHGTDQLNNLNLL
uniref:NADH-ubiquinone oxidoreductase chain 4L n=1 Tax=Gerrhopilus ceylonicus TaxID=3148149 RepID=A0PDM4_9SAUR|nr:NADH dehydrogenase subunit 4L [Gerrhopilus mirus]